MLAAYKKWKSKKWSKRKPARVKEVQHKAKKGAERDNIFMSLKKTMHYIVPLNLHHHAGRSAVVMRGVWVTLEQAVGGMSEPAGRGRGLSRGWTPCSLEWISPWQGAGCEGRRTAKKAQRWLWLWSKQRKGIGMKTESHSWLRTKPTAELAVEVDHQGLGRPVKGGEKGHKTEQNRDWRAEGGEHLHIRSDNTNHWCCRRNL